MICCYDMKNEMHKIIHALKEEVPSPSARAEQSWEHMSSYSDKFQTKYRVHVILLAVKSLLPLGYS